MDTGADIAKESADLILLEKDLMVLQGGVIEGRKVFANIIKYIRMGASSNFGNMFSVLGASAFLPFIPMAPIQILSNNMLYDFSQVPIPTDLVDEEQVAHPRPWNIGEIRRFILWIGPISSIFDYTTFFVMLYLFKCWAPARAPLFQTGWFVESLMTQTLIIHIDVYKRQLLRSSTMPSLRLHSRRPVSYTHLDALAFLKRTEAVRLNGGVMNEDVFAVFAAQKSKTLGVVKPLDCSPVSYTHLSRALGGLSQLSCNWSLARFMFAWPTRTARDVYKRQQRDRQQYQIDSARESRTGENAESGVVDSRGKILLSRRI